MKLLKFALLLCACAPGPDDPELEPASNRRGTGAASMTQDPVSPVQAGPQGGSAGSGVSGPSMPPEGAAGIKDPFLGLPYRYSAVYDSTTTVTLKWAWDNYRGTKKIYRAEIRLDDGNGLKLLRTLLAERGNLLVPPDLAVMTITLEGMPPKASTPKFPISFYDVNGVLLFPFTVVPQ